MGISSEHNDYKLCYSRWKMAFDFYRGGRHVLEPDWAASSHHWVIDRGQSDAEDVALGSDRQSSGYEWIPSQANSYLWKHPSERREEYEERHSRAVHYPHFSQYVDIYVSGIFKSGQSRENITAPFEEYLKDVNLTGDNIDIFMRRMLAYGIVFGRCHAITDMPVYDGMIKSLAEQRYLGIRAYSRIITPLDLVDWETDEHGNFNWIKVREEVNQPRDFLDDKPKTVYQYRVLTKDSWHVFVDSNGGEMVAEGYYPESLSGRVPISTVWCAKERAMACESPIASIVDGDRHLFNKMSELDTIERLNGFAMLCVPNLEGAPVAPIDIGPGRALSYPAQAGSPSWLSSDSSVLAGLSDRVEREAHSLRVLAGVSRGAAEGSKELRSASALAEEAENRRNQMAIWSASCQECERDMLSQAANWEGLPLSSIPKVSYQMNFNTRATSIQINDLNQLNSTMAINSDVRKELVKPIIYQMLKDNGVSEYDILKVIEMLGKEEVVENPTNYKVEVRS